MVMNITSMVPGTAMRGIRAIMALDIILQPTAVQGQVHQPRGDAMQLAKRCERNARL